MGTSKITHSHHYLSIELEQRLSSGKPPKPGPKVETGQWGQYKRPYMLNFIPFEMIILNFMKLNDILYPL